VLKELRRRGNVELLEGDIVRFKSATTQTRGVTTVTVGKAALRMRRLGRTLIQKILDPEQARLYEETGKITLSAKQLAIIRPVLESGQKSSLNQSKMNLARRACEIPTTRGRWESAYFRGMKDDVERRCVALPNYGDRSGFRGSLLPL